MVRVAADHHGMLLRLASIRQEWHAALHKSHLGFGPIYRPVAKIMLKALLALLPSLDHNHTRRLTSILIYSFAYCFVLPIATVHSTLGLHHGFSGLCYGLDALIALFDFILSCMPSWPLLLLERIVTVSFSGIQTLLEWRACVREYNLLYGLLPLSVWLLFNRDFLSNMRRKYLACKAFVTGRAHQSKCLLQMITRRHVPKRKPEEGDMCPICLDPLEPEGEEEEEKCEPCEGGGGGGLVYCKWGCGRPVHAACMQSWRGHRNAVGMTECLFCKAWM